MPSARVTLLQEIEEARRRLDGILKPTPLIRSSTLDRIFDAHVFIKPENLQKTGSFKIRGAYNRLATLTDEQKSRGVVAASAGNHGQALAYAATRAESSPRAPAITDRRSPTPPLVRA